MMPAFDKQSARILAKRYSLRFLTHWYVREVSKGEFEPWAHHSGDERTVAVFYCGEEVKD